MSSLNKYGLKPGQRLWFVPSDKQMGEREVEITKVGRVWAEIKDDNRRLALDTLKMDGGDTYSPGQCWLSQDAWYAERRRRRAWTTLKGHMSEFQPPDGVTADHIEHALLLLGFTPDLSVGDERATLFAGTRAYRYEINGRQVAGLFQITDSGFKPPGPRPTELEWTMSRKPSADEADQMALILTHAAQTMRRWDEEHGIKL